MEKFTDIGQFRNVIREVKSNHDYIGDNNNNPVYRHEMPYPVLTFRGTVKLHGTNAGICAIKTPDGIKYHFQSRNDMLSLEEDNAGFMNYMVGCDYQSLFEDVDFNETCVIYGEWAGKGIQKGMAINQLDKFMMVFAIRIDGEYVNLEKYRFVKNENQRIYNILDFPHFTIDIDFNKPELYQNKLIEMMLSVEDECPVGKQFGISGLGEGIVFEAFHPITGRRYIFKVKGDKHSKSKVTKLKQVDDELINKYINIAEQVTPSWRLEQMMNLACDTTNGGFIDRKHLGVYMKMVIDDIQKEEMDIIEDAGIQIKDIAKYISQIAKVYFFEQELNNL